MLCGGLTVGGTVSARPAQAATIPLAGVTAQLSDHHGTAGTDSANCIKYSPSGSATSTAFVSAGQTAITAHGVPAGGSCPGTLSTSVQSALGVSPSSVNSVNDGTPFLLSSITHWNNPISAGIAARYTGNLTIRIGGFDQQVDLVYPWTMWETPNTENPCAFPQGPNQNGCADQVTFTAAASTQTLTKNGVTYKLVINGFGPSTNGTCPAAPGATTPSADFLTAERATTLGCIYGTLSQVRSLTVVKQVVGNPPMMPAFGYSSTSSLTGSPWAGSNFTLTPPGAASVTRELLQGESVSVTEALPPGDQWSLTRILCTNGDGTPLAAANYDLAAGRVSINNTPAPTSAAAGPITCTYTNTYTPTGTLTLVKQVNGGSATASQFTLTASGPTPISGPGGSAAITNQRVTAGTYTLSEATQTSGYVPGAWTCTGATLNGNQLTVPDGANVTCTVSNRYATGNFQITKTVQGPSGSPAYPTTVSFTGSYQCGTSPAVDYTVTTGTPFTSPQLPAGTVCSITENTPSGNLPDSSYAWQAPVLPNGGRITISDQGTATMPITNSYVRQTGSVSLSKVVTPRPGTPALAYTGGPTRAFPVNYTCTIGANTVAQGQATVRPDGNSVQIPNLPATSTCTFTEDQTPAPGDFRSAANRWDGYAFAPATVTVPVNGTVSSTVTNYFIRDTASLTLAKQVSGGGYLGSGQPFTLHWDCGIASGDVQLGAGSSQSVTVPANVQCTVSEAPPAANLLDAGHVWGTPIWTGLTNGTVSVPPGGSAQVSVTNPTVPVFGRVGVNKAISPSQYASAVRPLARFNVTVSCNAPAQGQTGNYTQTFSIPADAPAVTTPELPLGTSCTVTEAAPQQSGLVDDSYRWGSTPGAQTVTVDNRDEVRTVTVTNTVTRAYGSLAITKAIQPLNGVTGASTTFTGRWSCVYGDDPAVAGTWTRTGAGAAILSGPTGQILIGSTCTVFEDERNPLRPNPNDPSYVWGPHTVTGPVAITAANPNGQVTVTNPVVRLTGSFGVGKIVRGGTAGTAFTDGDFGFAYTCTQPDNTVLNGTLTVRAGQAVNGPSLPAGTQCTVTETSRPNAINPYRWDPTRTTLGYGDNEGTSSSVSFTVPNDPINPIKVRAYNYIGVATADVRATKQVAGPGFVDGPDATFDLSLVCALNGATSSYGPLATRAGAANAATFSSIPVGSVCHLAEEPIPPGAHLLDASYRWDRTPVFTPATVTVDTATTNDLQVTNTIVRAYGALALEKTLSAPAGVVDPTRTYSGGWTCTHSGDAAVSGSWTVDGTGRAALTGVPDEGILLGSTCTPTETGGITTPPSTDPSYQWDTPTLTPASPSSAATAVMGVDNRVSRSTVPIRVAKTLSGVKDGYTGTGTPFGVDLRCVAPGSTDAPVVAHAQLAPDGTLHPLADIPTGWNCLIGEASPTQDLLRNPSYAWGTPSYAGAPGGSFSAGAGTDIVVDNPVLRRTGGFALTKAIASGTPDGVVLPTASFTGGYNCSYNPGQPDAASWTGRWQVTGAGGAAAFDPPLPELPVGTVCGATEDAPNGGLVDQSWAWGTPTLSAPVTVGAQTTETVTVTNTPQRVYSSARVTKTYTGVAGALPPGLNVTIAYACTPPDGGTPLTGTVTVPAAGGAADLFRADGSVRTEAGPVLVPAGSRCRIAEQTLLDSDLTDGSYGWNAEAYAPGQELTTAAAGTAEVGITNSTHRVYQQLQVRKQIIGVPDGVAVRSPLQFTGTYECRYGTDAPVTGDWLITDQGSTTVNGILVGSQCSVTSEDTVAQLPVPTDESYKWGAWRADGPTTLTRDQVGNLTVTNPVERMLTELRITKRLDPAQAAQLPAGTRFEVSYTCTSQSGEERAGQYSLAVGETWTSPSDIPIGSRCRVVEGTLPTAPVGQHWQQPGFTVDGLLEPPVVDGPSVSFTIPAGRSDLQIAHPLVSIRNALSDDTASFTLDKASDPVSGSQVDPGGTIRYRLTLTPTGSGVRPGVIVTDDLSQVLAHATVDQLDPSQGTVTLSGNRLVWAVGTVAADGGPLTLTYRATVNADAWGQTLRNAVTSNVPPATCPACHTSTEHRTPPSFTLDKSANPASGSLVNPGEAIVYRVTLSPSAGGGVRSGVVVTDDLSQVLDSATVDQVSASQGSAVLTGTRLVWTVGDVTGGSAPLTLTYRSTVRPDAWGRTIRNLVLANVPPAECSKCHDSTEHHTPPPPVTPSPTPTPQPPTPPAPQPPAPQPPAPQPPAPLPPAPLPDTGGPGLGLGLLGLVSLLAGIWALRRGGRGR
ncbi:hypothetical protein CGZ93_04255 [Enemella dayhoffiae]|uniref:Uncharacterized protein n=2 Tax=Enemella dayhoffiae TaxID=2016507 RepID=A0A255H9P2_9ACTN|nr:hypothetical protein CGZ93_04255 [Enemella dayhoffiae]